MKIQFFDYSFAEKFELTISIEQTTIYFLLIFNRSNFDSRVTNEFATAAFRLGHTLIPDIIETFSTITGEARRTIELAETFGDGDILRETNFIDELFKGMTIQVKTNRGIQLRKKR